MYPDVLLLSINSLWSILLLKLWHPMFSRFFLCFDTGKCNLLPTASLSFAGLPRLFPVRWRFFYVNGTFHCGITKPFILAFTGVHYWNSQHLTEGPSRLTVKSAENNEKQKFRQVQPVVQRINANDGQERKFWFQLWKKMSGNSNFQLTITRYNQVNTAWWREK